MDEVITCHCGCQNWVIGTSGTRCANCNGFLSKGAVSAAVRDVNSSLRKSKQTNVISRHEVAGDVYIAWLCPNCKRRHNSRYEHAKQFKHHCDDRYGGCGEDYFVNQTGNEPME